tara:strand:+ start:4191 stop:4826 length:636 start_codon:yes stop_codon:yes gene_type:complete
MQKKRGRKPKGGQVIKKSIKKKEEECNKNIILHLKVKCNSENIIKEYNYYNNDKVIKQNNISVIQTKLKNLQYDLHTNSLYNKSDCFWCTCSFKSEPIYIPNSIMNNKYKVYGNFCSPQCAAAFLFNENIDSNVKYNRYSLLNSMYKEIFDYNKNIQPAPKPYYLLDKFLGNLSISEYREILNKNNNTISIVDKPISNIFPELHTNNLSSI